MGQVTVSVNGKNYHLACAEGGEEQLRQLAAFIDGKARGLLDQLGHISESRLLLMTALLIADELHDTLEGKTGKGLTAAMSEEDVSAILDEVSGEIDSIAHRLENT